VQKARSSAHRFPSPEALKKALISNYEPVPDPGGYFDEVYVFPM
jgi:hypothetical protein